MEVINSDVVFEEFHIASKEEFLSSVDEKKVRSLMDHYDEPCYFFRGAVFGLILCVPFWALLFWFIT